MTRYLLFVLSVIFIFLVPFSCKDNPITIKDDPPKIICYDTLALSYNPLMPGKVGSYWKYKLYIYNKTKWHENDSTWVYHDFSSFGVNFNDTSLTIFDSKKREIANSLTVHYGNYCYDVVAYTNSSLSYEDTDKLYWLYWISPEGIFEMGGYETADTMVSKGLKIPYPLKKGEQWKGQYTYYENTFHAIEPIIRECVADNEKLVTPFFTVDSCYVILTRVHPSEDVGGFDDSYQYYAPNKGLICQVLKHTSPDNLHWFIGSVSVEYEYLIK